MFLITDRYYILCIRKYTSFSCQKLSFLAVFCSVVADVSKIISISLIKVIDKTENSEKKKFNIKDKINNPLTGKTNCQVCFKILKVLFFGSVFLYEVCNFLYCYYL